MKINNSNNNKTNFKGLPLSPLSQGLYALQNNDMLNASFVDIFAMDTPRTVVEFNNRGKNAGLEMGFREYTGTFIAEFSATLFALLSSKIFSKKYKPDVKINEKSFATNASLDVFSEIFNKSDKTPIDFAKKSLESIEGISGNKKVSFANLKEETKTPIVENLANLITKKSDKKDVKNLEDSIIQALKADNNITVKTGEKEFSANLSHVIRDIADLGKNVFFSKENKPDEIISKLKTLNKSRIATAIPLSMAIAITNQYINRRITKARTGIDNFVGENDYEKNVQNKDQKKNQKGLMAKKVASAGVFLLMLSKVMGIKKPADIINKLEFNGPATSGNAIKTIYGTLILGRIFASKDSTELRETNVRDYLGFLNWLVLGGFAAKGVGQILDSKQENLFNISKEGKGIKHWLSNVSLKSQKEIIAQGGNVKKNLRNLNIAQLSGIAYSAVMLGVLLPKLNIWMTKNKKPKETTKEIQTTNLKNINFDDFKKSTQKTMI